MRESAQWRFVEQFLSESYRRDVQMGERYGPLAVDVVLVQT